VEALYLDDAHWWEKLSMGHPVSSAARHGVK